MRVCVGDAQWDGLLPTFPAQSVTKTWPPFLTTMFILRLLFAVKGGFPALNSVTDPKPLESAGHRVEEAARAGSRALVP